MKPPRGLLPALPSCLPGPEHLGTWHLQVRAIRVDVLCWCLGDSWQSSAYQRAIGCDSLWLTLMRMLEPDSIFKIGRIAFSAGIPSSGQSDEETLAAVAGWQPLLCTGLNPCLASAGRQSCHSHV